MSLSQKLELENEHIEAQLPQTIQFGESNGSSCLAT